MKEVVKTVYNLVSENKFLVKTNIPIQFLLELEDHSVQIQ